MSKLFSTTYKNVDRSQKIEKLKKYYNGDGFDIFMDSEVNTSSIMASSIIENWKYRYKTSNYLKRIMNEYRNYIPLLKLFNTDDDNVIKVLQKFLEDVHWDLLQYEINLKQELAGDCFIYWFFDKKNKLKLKVLPSENMIDISIDKDGEIECYIYQEDITYNITDPLNGRIINKTDTIKWLFYRGYIVKFTNGSNRKIFNNKMAYRDMFQVLHIPSDKEYGEKFSEIPAEEFIDDCIWLDGIESDRREINILNGFPRLISVGCSLNKSQSENSAGGVYKFDIDNAFSSGATVKQMEIMNDLISIKDERGDVLKSLYKKASLPPESTEEKMLLSDSARVPAQVRLPLELKLNRRLTNVAESSADIFFVVLNEEGIKTDKTIKFKLPKPIIPNSIFDEKVLETQDLANGQETIQTLHIKNGKTNEESKVIYNQMLENKKDIAEIESSGNNTDIEEIDVENKEDIGNNKGIGIDNRFKQKTNV